MIQVKVSSVFTRIKPHIRRSRRFIKQLLGLAPKLVLDEKRTTIRLGSDYGGWSLCPTLLSARSIVYSVGVGADISFDLALIRHFGVTVNAFDPTAHSIEWVKRQSLPLQFVFHAYGIATVDGSMKFFKPRNSAYISHSTVSQSLVSDEHIEVPVVRLETAMKQLGHGRIDLLKMDIEGAEYGVIEDIIKSRIPIAQILVEFHHQYLPNGKRKTEESLHLLRENGYHLFAYSDTGSECSFIYIGNK